MAILIMQYKQGILGTDVAHITSSSDISVYVWDDVNQNGVHKAGEGPLSGYTVWLTDAAETPLSSTTTVGGFAVFNFVSAGNYKIQVIPAGKDHSPKFVLPSHPLQTSWINPGTGYSDIIVMDGIGTPLTLQAGLY